MNTTSQMIGFADFINYLMNKYDLEKINSKKAIRAKITYTLKNEPKYIKNNIWETAPTKNIHGHNQKLFNTTFLKELEIQIEPYLRKLSEKEGNLTPQEIELRAKKQNKEYEDWLNELLNRPQEDEYYSEMKNYGKPEEGKPLEAALDRLMLRAIFKHFFTMSEKQKKQFADDRKYLYMDPQDFIGSPDYAKASYRQEHPEKYYYDEKNKTTHNN
ncbi:hypothetical protein [Lactobacillus gallinarum]|uniref:Uncharacterized protein n=1 Tax=Lactobacillus gallinarum TaxID=52242 RepID=A0A1Y4VYQ4_9LACO|nr:hypothetical protein [Lactobacillus gallinarum]OUQ74436.1 hypothetical protein B5E44_09745 [Lactobacillus gallinarum]